MDAEKFSVWKTIKDRFLTCSVTARGIVTNERIYILLLSRLLISGIGFFERGGTVKEDCEVGGVRGGIFCMFFASGRHIWMFNHQNA